MLSGLTDAAACLKAVRALRGFNVQEALPLPARKDIVQLNVPADVDGFAEFWVDDVADYAAAMDDPAAADWRAARARLCGAARTLVLRENPLIPVPADRPPTRNNAFLTRNARFETSEAFLHEWLIGHGAMCLTIPYLKAFVPCVVTDRLPPMDLPELPTDEIEGIAQAYFDTPEDEIAMIQTPEAKEWFAHGAITFGLIKAFGARETVASIPAEAQAA
jgi:hypothetical protein